MILLKEHNKYYQQVPYFLGNNANIMVNNQITYQHQYPANAYADSQFQAQQVRASPKSHFMMGGGPASMFNSEGGGGGGGPTVQLGRGSGLDMG